MRFSGNGGGESEEEPTDEEDSDLRFSVSFPSC